MGCRASRSADVEVESILNLEVHSSVPDASAAAAVADRHADRLQRGELGQEVDREFRRSFLRQRQRRRYHEPVHQYPRSIRRMASSAVVRNQNQQSQNENQRQQSPDNSNANTSINATLDSNLASIMDLDRRRHWLDEVDNWDNIGPDLDFDNMQGGERDHSFFLRRELIPDVATVEAANAARENRESSDVDTGLPTNTVTTNGEQLDRLRSDLVTLERLFHTLLGQRLAEGINNGPGGIASQSSACPPAAPHVVENLHTICISKCDFEDGCNNNRECSICFLEHEVGDWVTRLPCGHFFHGECINEWLRKRCTCPICRWELETEDPIFELDRVERMKSRRIRVKDHELDRLCIGGLQELAGMKNVKNRAKLIRSIKNSKDVDIITKDKARP